MGIEALAGLRRAPGRIAERARKDRREKVWEAIAESYARMRGISSLLSRRAWESRIPRPGRKPFLPETEPADRGAPSVQNPALLPCAGRGPLSNGDRLRERARNSPGPRKKALDR